MSTQVPGPRCMTNPTAPGKSAIPNSFPLYGQLGDTELSTTQWPMVPDSRTEWALGTALQPSPYFRFHSLSITQETEGTGSLLTGIAVPSSSPTPASTIQKTKEVHRGTNDPAASPRSFLPLSCPRRTAHGALHAAFCSPWAGPWHPLPPARCSRRAGRRVASVWAPAAWVSLSRPQ